MFGFLPREAYGLTRVGRRMGSESGFDVSRGQKPKKKLSSVKFVAQQTFKESPFRTKKIIVVKDICPCMNNVYHKLVSLRIFSDRLQ